MKSPRLFSLLVMLCALAMSSLVTACSTGSDMNSSSGGQSSGSSGGY
ncbi:hypothetical protein [Paraburkholderia kururiensis]|nr:hypothetical protein [Paraburkholderia kururiensis]